MKLEKRWTRPRAKLSSVRHYYFRRLRLSLNYDPRTEEGLLCPLRQVHIKAATADEQQQSNGCMQQWLRVDGESRRRIICLKQIRMCSHGAPITVMSYRPSRRPEQTHTHPSQGRSSISSSSNTRFSSRRLIWNCRGSAGRGQSLTIKLLTGDNSFLWRRCANCRREIIGTAQKKERHCDGNRDLLTITCTKTKLHYYGIVQCTFASKAHLSLLIMRSRGKKYRSFSMHVFLCLKILIKPLTISQKRFHHGCLSFLNRSSFSLEQNVTWVDVILQYCQ